MCKISKYYYLLIVFLVSMIERLSEENGCHNQVTINDYQFAGEWKEMHEF